MNTHPTIDPATSTIYVDETRYNLYAVIHKTLRREQTLLLTRLGAVDAADREAVAGVVGKMRLLIAIGRGHLEHENIHIHEVIEARRRGATERLVDDHAHHERDFDELSAMLDAIEAAGDARRPSLLRVLYLRYSLFLAEDFEHMVEEETVTLSLLHQLFSDAELLAIEQRIIASIPPQEMMETLKMMMPSMNHGERMEMLGGMRAGMPAAIFSAVFDGVVRPSLGEAEFRRLEADLRLAA